jgi:hypothetical protein
MSDNDEKAPVLGRRRRSEGPNGRCKKRRKTLADSSDDEEFGDDDAAGSKGSGSSKDGGADNGESSYSSSRMKEAVVRSFCCICGIIHDPFDFLIFLLSSLLWR